MKTLTPVLLLASAFTLALTAPAQAADPYPNKPIRVIVPYPAGGVVDVQARIVTDRLAAELGQPFIVEARPGANGNIAAEAVARAPADGYTLLVSAPFLINNPLIETTLRWAPKDFTPVGRFALSPSYMVVPMSLPVKTVKDYVELAKKSKPPLQYGEGGTGSTQAMSNEMFQKLAGIEIEAVNYKGAPPVIPDLITGRITMAITPSTVALPQIAAGKLRPLVNISSRRSAQLPDVPTFAEAGYPGATALSWYAFHAPAGTPPDVIRRLDAALKVVTAGNDVKERLTTAGGEEAYLGTADFAAFLKADSAQWEGIAKAIFKK